MICDFFTTKAVNTLTYATNGIMQSTQVKRKCANIKRQ